MAGAFDLEDLDDALEEQEKAPAAAAPRLVPSAVYFQQAAARNIFWYHSEQKAWLRAADSNGAWRGWRLDPVEAASASNWTPWSSVLDDSDPPFYRWFAGGLTNAAFNEVDQHVLEGRGGQLAYIEEADPQVASDAGAQITRGELLARSAAAAYVLRTDFSLSTGDRVLFFLPAGIEQIVWVEACKRLGVVYCCCNPGLPPEQIADRVVILQAKVVVTAEHPDWSYVVHKALNNFVPVLDAIDRASKAFGKSRDELTIRWKNRVCVSFQEPPFSESKETIDFGASSLLGTKVLILGSLKLPMNELQAKTAAPATKAETRTVSALEVPKAELQGPQDVAALWKQHGAPVPVEANHPLFIIFTSGTTGKPKGVCHAHAYIAGLVETMKVVFNADPAVDRMLTVGALGWITGQSYQIAAVLASGVTSVLMRGNPVKPFRSRFADVINKHNITIFKAGSAFLREVMSTPEAMQEVRSKPMKSLRIATFCAEPVSEAVQAFAMSAVCKMYINSYWATEHGGIAWSRRFNNPEQPLKADAHSWPLPWVEADVYAYDETSKPSEEGGTWKARPAACGERGDVVCTSPYPYMFRFVWGDVENFGKPGWTGDRSAMLAKYWRRTQVPDRGEQWVYTQGDFAVRYADGAYTFHGRSDEVLNVNGILFGTEHVEGAILRDKQLNPDSKVGHCAVVGYPDEISGEVPMAFITPGDAASPPTTKDFMRLFRLVEETVGPLTVKFVVVSELPQTFSGKFMRRVLAAISRDKPLGDLSTISNPDCIPKIQEEFAQWKRQVEGVKS
mmetsp:Transcript_104786/g.337870  ORF Transcript_104786/g.337870 Transcript_104786/m.337870 type:complete len:790 (-) Transcript_104786:233-2602(-)